MEIGEDYLCFRGIRILDKFRRRGLTSTLLKVWILLCTVLKKIPTTIKMNKPLLCIALQNLGLVPISKKNKVEVCKPNWQEDVINDEAKNFVLIWSENMTLLRGSYSKSFLKTQQLQIVDEKPLNSRTIYISKYTIPSSPTTAKEPGEVEKNNTSSINNRITKGDIPTSNSSKKLILAISNDAIEKHKCLFYNARLHAFIEMIVHEKQSQKQNGSKMKNTGKKPRRHKSFKKYIDGEESVGNWVQNQQKAQYSYRDKNQ